MHFDEREQRQTRLNSHVWKRTGRGRRCALGLAHDERRERLGYPRFELRNNPAFAFCMCLRQRKTGISKFARYG
jgi:hypothetical protein